MQILTTILVLSSIAIDNSGLDRQVRNQQPRNNKFYEYYLSCGKKFALATPEQSVFFHELAHVAHARGNGGLNGGQDPIQEILPELSAAALCRIVGKKLDNIFGNFYRYLRYYTSELNLAIHIPCFKVMSETEKVLNTNIGECFELY